MENILLTTKETIEKWEVEKILLLVKYQLKNILPLVESKEILLDYLILYNNLKNSSSNEEMKRMEVKINNLFN